MLAISVRQPWAELILQARKRIEVRTWTVSYRGPLWLHAGRQPDDAAAAHFGLKGCFMGGYVGQVSVDDIVLFDRDRWQQWREYHLVPGPLPEGAFAWILSQPIRLLPNVPGPGRLKLFQVDAGLEQELQKAVLNGRGSPIGR